MIVGDSKAQKFDDLGLSLAAVLLWPSHNAQDVPWASRPGGSGTTAELPVVLSQTSREVGGDARVGARPS